VKADDQADESRTAEGQNTAGIVAELQRRGAESFPHGRSSLLRHLCSTRDILKTWHQPKRVRLAGVVHSGYATQAFPRALFDLTERDTVRTLIGDEAERLVYLFCALDREELFAYLRSSDGMAEDPVRLFDRMQHAKLELGRRDVGDLLALYVANAADQACLADGGPTCWLASAAELARWAAKNAEVVPPILDGCTAAVSRELEECALVAYDTALRMLSADIGVATAGLAGASRDMPHVAEPLVWLGYLSLSRGDADGAQASGVRAATLFDTWGTPWDKRLTLRQWRMLVGNLVTLASSQEAGSIATREATSAALKATTGSPEDFYIAMDDTFMLGRPSMPHQRTATTEPSSRSGSLPTRFQQYIARNKSERGHRQGNVMYPGLTARPWHDPRQFPVAMALENAADEIAAELQELSSKQFVDEAEQIARVGRWSVVFLVKQRVRCDDVCSICPATASVLDAHRDETLLAGAAYFSCLDPGTHVAPHRGPTNTRLRCHLGIEVPDDCGLKVGGITGAWQRGRCIVFDDSFVHEVWNWSPMRRAVLIVDIWHPDLTPDEITLLQWVCT
jgi:hypothetical protein